jgi:hypothetical protein
VAPPPALGVQVCPVGQLGEATRQTCAAPVGQAPDTHVNVATPALRRRQHVIVHMPMVFPHGTPAPPSAALAVDVELVVDFELLEVALEVVVAADVLLPDVAFADVDAAFEPEPVSVPVAVLVPPPVLLLSLVPLVLSEKLGLATWFSSPPLQATTRLAHVASAPKMLPILMDFPPKRSSGER